MTLIVSSGVTIKDDLQMNPPAPPPPPVLSGAPPPPPPPATTSTPMRVTSRGTVHVVVPTLAKTIAL